MYMHAQYSVQYLHILVRGAGTMDRQLLLVVGQFYVCFKLKQNLYPIYKVAPEVYM